MLIETRCTELGAASARMHQRALRHDTLLAEARLRIGFVGPDGRPRRQPSPWRAAFAPFLSTSDTAGTA